MMTKDKTDIAHAVKFAMDAHGNQRYGREPYYVHLKEVAHKVTRYAPLDQQLQCAAWLHDVIEDTTVTLQEVGMTFGDDIAELVWAVSNPKKMERPQAHKIVFERILKKGERALLLKLCDRVCNVSRCHSHGVLIKLAMYRREYPEFKTALYAKSSNPALTTLWEELDGLLA